MSGFMKTVLKNSATITHILPRFRFSFRPCKRAKIQRKEDSERQEKKEKKRTDFPFDFYMVAFGVSWQDKKAHLGRDFNSSVPFSKIQTYIQSMPPTDH